MNFCFRGWLQFADGTRFVGQWFNDRQSGYGKLTNRDGAKYEGDSLPIRCSKDLSFFSGNFRVGYREGSGKYENSLGLKYSFHYKKLGSREVGNVPI